MLSDTSPQAEKVQLDLLRRMSVAQRLNRMREWTRTLVHLSRNGLARAHIPASTIVSSTCSGSNSSMAET